MLIIGYCEKHKETCDEDDCPLKIDKKVEKDAKDKTGVSDMNDLCNNLVLVINRMYKIGVKKFPDSTELRINYAIFLLERMNNKKKSIEQLNLADETKPNFE